LCLLPRYPFVNIDCEDPPLFSAQQFLSRTPSSYPSWIINERLPLQTFPDELRIGQNKRSFYPGIAQLKKDDSAKALPRLFREANRSHVPFSASGTCHDSIKLACRDRSLLCRLADRFFRSSSMCAFWPAGVLFWCSLLVCFYSIRVALLS